MELRNKQSMSDCELEGFPRWALLLRFAEGLAIAVLLTFSIAKQAAAQVPLTRTCFFVVGPKAGQTQQFPAAQPIAVGAACQDGQGTRGISVRDGDLNPKGTFAIVQGTPTCTDILQTSVRYVPNQSIPKTGLSTVDPQGPVIYLKTLQMNTMPMALQNYLYAHECGHHALGQVLAFLRLGAPALIGPDQEIAADCFSIIELRKQHVLDDSDTNTVLNVISTLPADAANYPGPARVQKIKACANLP